MKRLLFFFVRIVPLHSSFFIYKSLSKSVKVSKEAVELEYKRMAPLTYTTLLYLQREKDIYIWFTNFTFDKLGFYIPEVYLFYLATQNPSKTILYIVRREYLSEIYIILIEKGSLKEAYSISKDELEHHILLLSQKYSIDEIKELEIDKYKSYIEDGLKKIEWKDLKFFFMFPYLSQKGYSFDSKKLPFILCFGVFFYLVITYTQGFILKEKLNYKLQKLSSLKNQNDKVKELIRKYKDKKRFLERFLYNECSFYSPFYVLDVLHKKLLESKENSLLIKEFVYKDGRLRLRIESKQNAPNLVDMLNSVPIFSNVVLVSSYKKKNMYRYLLNIQVAKVLRKNEEK